MVQLKYNENFDSIIKEIPIWSEENIPQNILDFMEKKEKNMVIYEESQNTFYCENCLEPLENFICPKCHQVYPEILLENLNTTPDMIIKDKIENLEIINVFYVFEIYGSDVILYKIRKENRYSMPPYLSKTSKQSKIEIVSSYLVEKNSLTELKTSKVLSFETLVKEMKERTAEFNFEDISSYNARHFLYTENLLDLKNTIYKYSRIWELKEFYESERNISLYELTFFPLYYPSYEYLVNYKLYDLARKVPYLFCKGKNFQEIFGVEKKYLSFMQKINISPYEWKVMQICPMLDKEALKYFGAWCDVYCSYYDEWVRVYHMNLKELYDYLKREEVEYWLFPDYIDYLDMANTMRLDLKKKDVLYPKNFMEAHDKLYQEMEIMKDPEIDSKIKSLSNVLKLNYYEDEDYVIYPASSIEDLIKESQDQHNCVRTYGEKVASVDSEIYFMRKKSDLNHSFVTIEVIDKKVVQARCKYNEDPSEDIWKVIEKWEKNLIPVIKQK